ncbi:MAG: hypothetical protein R3234_06890 [Thermoanaerobaculia bacterium]|nr:hypothetical protein [Thermoanaerobaculia bacterium]
MRDVVYSVASSLDGFLAGPEGEHDWIPVDVGIDWPRSRSRLPAVSMLSREETTQPITVCSPALTGQAICRAALSGETLLGFDTS